MKRILGYYLKPYYLRMAMGFFIKFTGTIMDLLLPWALAHMIDVVIPENRSGDIIKWGLFMVFCSVVAVVFNIVANRMAARVASDAIYTIRQDLFSKVMYLSNSQVDWFTRPSLISRLTSDTYNVHQMLSRMQRLGVRSPILLIGGLSITMMLHPALAGVLLCTLPLLAAVVIGVSKKSIPLFSLYQDSLDRFVRLVREDVAGIRVIKALSKEEFERQRYDKANRQVVEKERLATITTAVTNPAMNLFLNLGLVGVIFVGAYRVNAGLTQVGKILAFMTYFTIILNALLSISKMFVLISKGTASASRMEKVFSAEDSRTLKLLEKEWTDEKDCHIEFDHVSFSYNKKRNNLEDISFCLKRGETLGIIGATGAGKSTVANLLMRFYDVDQGAIRIDGKDIRSMDLKTLRQKFGAVFQNDVIFEDSIMENISMGRNLTKEQAQEAACYARAEEFIRDKGGLEEALDVRGANLSGGQKQRLLIARALASKPEILILDDSSSALDYKTDAALRKGLKERYSQTTCIIIAQRISSIMNADHILVLDEGRCIGYGTHEKLMADCEVYGEIGKSQMGIEVEVNG
ncbi:MAG TPA: ABC transporter ATP-binding protein/permease [Candidatus Hungatella pullicola]|nr:ABC transporter ATP-binding protein/permease [Candidatus Hungatella pullicola]